MHIGDLSSVNEEAMIFFFYLCVYNVDCNVFVTIYIKREVVSTWCR